MYIYAYNVYIYRDKWLHLQGSSSTYRRKFRSHTVHNIDTWKSRGGTSQRRERKKKEDQRRERVREKKVQVGEKVETSRNTASNLLHPITRSPSYHTSYVTVGRLNTAGFSGPWILYLASDVESNEQASAGTVLWMEWVGWADEPH